MLAGIALLLVMLALWIIASPYLTGVSRWGQNSREASQAAFEEKTGVRVVRVAVTAGGGMIDLRYQVIDPDKALIVHDKENPPAIVDEATGQAINRPWMDHSRVRELHAAVTYPLLLMNAGGVIKRGSTVTVVMGEARLENVVVQ